MTKKYLSKVFPAHIILKYARKDDEFCPEKAREAIETIGTRLKVTFHPTKRTDLSKIAQKVREEAQSSISYLREVDDESLREFIVGEEKPRIFYLELRAEELEKELEASQKENRTLYERIESLEQSNSYDKVLTLEQGVSFSPTFEESYSLTKKAEENLASASASLKIVDQLKLEFERASNEKKTLESMAREHLELSTSLKEEVKEARYLQESYEILREESDKLHVELEQVKRRSQMKNYLLIGASIVGLLFGAYIGSCSPSSSVKAKTEISGKR